MTTKKSRPWIPSLVGMALAALGPLLLIKGCQVLSRSELNLVHDREGISSSPSEAAWVPPPGDLDPGLLEKRSFGEAPLLLDQVEKGVLPPVSKRLPKDPLVVVPFEEIGQYGGTLRRALTGDIVQVWGVSKTLSEGLMGYKRPLADGIVKNLAAGYEFSADKLSITFTLREGLRWSDGAPFTVDDILFWYYDMCLDLDASDSPLPPSEWMSKGEPMVFEKLDDRRFTIHSKEPLGRVLEDMCGDFQFYPRHLLKEWHPRYNPQATYEAFREKTTRAQLLMTPGIPQMSAWVPVEWVRGQRIVYSRNPYYWKVDSEGNQLPYADRLVFEVIQDKQIILLKFMNGEIDLFGRYSGIEMLPTLKAEERNGRYRVHLSGPYAGTAFYLNWDSPREALREAFRDLQVRIALSHAIHRYEISQVVFNGMMELSLDEAPSGRSFFQGTGHRQYWEYNPEKAKHLLDQAGYMDRDGDGWRELKDGSPFELTIDVAIPGAEVDIVELVREYWAKIGVKVYINAALRDIIWPRRETAEFDIHVWGLEGCADLLVRPWDWALIGDTYPFWHRNAEREAPEWLNRAAQLFQRALITVDQDAQDELVDRIREIYVEHIPMLVIGQVYAVWGSNSRLGNVPEDAATDDVFRGWSRPIYHEQIFIKSPKAGEPS